MDFKKKCINFKKSAKNFGYEIKLTHVQELLAKYEGFENRHALLKSLSSNEKKVIKRETKDYYYFDVHVAFGGMDGYSYAYRSKDAMFKENGEVDFEKIVKKIKNLGLLNEGDYKYIDSINEIDEGSWKSLSNYDDSKIECVACNQLYYSSELSCHKKDRLEVCCDSCEKNEVKMFISTDDGEFYYVETFIDNDYLEWAIKENTELLSLLSQGFLGPDSYTDSLLFESSSPTARNIANYLETINNSRRGRLHVDLVGYSVYVDEDSFKNWAKRNMEKLRDVIDFEEIDCD